MEAEEALHGLVYEDFIVQISIKSSFILKSYQDHLDSKEAFRLKAGTWGGRGEEALWRSRS